MYANNVVSPDLRSTMVVMFLPTGISIEYEEELKRVVDAHVAGMDRPDDGIRFAAGGLPLVNVWIGRYLLGDLKLLIPFVLLVILGNAPLVIPGNAPLVILGLDPRIHSSTTPRKILGSSPRMTSGGFPTMTSRAFPTMTGRAVPMTVAAFLPTPTTAPCPGTTAPSRRRPPRRARRASEEMGTATKAEPTSLTPAKPPVASCVR